MKIYYEYDKKQNKYDCLKTLCPYKLTYNKNKIIKVNGGFCIECKYYCKTNKEKNYIICKNNDFIINILFKKYL